MSQLIMACVEACTCDCTPPNC